MYKKNYFFVLSSNEGYSTLIIISMKNKIWFVQKLSIKSYVYWIWTEEKRQHLIQAGVKYKVLSVSDLNRGEPFQMKDVTQETMKYCHEVLNGIHLKQRETL